ncbi:MAG: hypothetical protein ABIH83_03920 [Candidatus Micrarchaeota archaeon]
MQVKRIIDNSEPNGNPTAAYNNRLRQLLGPLGRNSLNFSQSISVNKIDNQSFPRILENNVVTREIVPRNIR